MSLPAMVYQVVNILLRLEKWLLIWSCGKTGANVQHMTFLPLLSQGILAKQRVCRTVSLSGKQEGAFCCIFASHSRSHGFCGVRVWILLFVTPCAFTWSDTFAWDQQTYVETKRADHFWGSFSSRIAAPYMSGQKEKNAYHHLRYFIH